MSRPLQAIIFDFDGVIANSEPLHLRAFQESLGAEGVVLEADDYYARYLGYDDIGLLEALARDRQLPWNRDRLAELVDAKGACLQRMLGAGKKHLAGAVVPCAIASGALRHEIVEILDGAGLRGCFSTIVASGDTPQSKPSPAPYRLAFDRLAAGHPAPLERGRCVAIEDSHWGLESARGAGLRLVGVTTSYRADELPAAELVVSGLAALTLDALDGLCHAEGPR